MHRMPRSSRLAVLLVLPITVALAVLPVPRAAAQTRILFTEYAFNDPAVRAMDLDGSNLELLFTPPLSEWLAVGCDYDPGSGRIYWTNGNFNAGTIRRAALDGSAMQLLVSGLKLPRGLALDVAGDKMYWTNSPPAGNASGLVQRANLDGSGLETIYALDPYDPVLSFVGRPAVDPVNGYVYVCAEGEIRRMPLGGGPPVQTVVRGVTTVTSVALDVAADRIYFLDANTNSDYVGRCRLDDTGFEVLVDISPASSSSSGLQDLVLDLQDGTMFWSNDILDTIERADLDGGNRETLFASTRSPTGLALDVAPAQPMQDCNENGIRDLDDILSMTSEDCNGNGIPDECEEDPCAPESFLVDYGSDPALAARSLSGDPATGYELFQAFDIVDPEVTLERIQLDGHTLSYHPDGFTLTVFPDDGTGTFPDETLPVESAAFQLRFSLDHVVWVERPFGATLAAGRYWVRLTANDPAYAAGVHAGTSGPPSVSRRLSTGQIIQASQPLALRVAVAPPSTAVAADAGGAERPAAGVALSVPAPNPTARGSRLELTLATAATVRVAVFDAAGRLVRRLATGRLPAGTHRLHWDGRDAAGHPAGSGVYFLRASIIDGVVEGAAAAGAAQRVLVVH